MYNIVLIEKYHSDSCFWSNLLKYKRIEKLSVEEILNKYQSFEGEIIAFYKIQNVDSELNNSVNNCLELKEGNKNLMLHVISYPTSMPFTWKSHATLMGYDVGVCEEGKTIYSSIFNEILFGHLDELVSYKCVLNENLLFSTRTIAEEYVNLHNQLSAQGRGVEDYEPMTIYEIWRHKIS